MAKAKKAKKAKALSVTKILRDLIPKEARQFLEEDRRQMKREIARLRKQAKDATGALEAEADSRAEAYQNLDDLRHQLQSAKWEKDAADDHRRRLRSQLDTLITGTGMCCQVLNVGQEVVERGTVCDRTIQADEFLRGKPYAWDELGNPITEPVPPEDPAHRLVLHLIAELVKIRKSL